jgi:hypothetical protein
MFKEMGIGKLVGNYEKNLYIFLVVTELSRNSLDEI